MSNDSLTELAKLFSERDNSNPLSITTGKVVSPPPNPLIRLDDVILLDGSNLIFASHLVNGYKRKIRFTDTDCGMTVGVNDGGQGASTHSHEIAEIHIDTMMEWTDTLQKDDEVILVPVSDGQLYYVIDKAVRF